MTKFNADTGDAFIEAANKKFGGDSLGETKHHAALSPWSFKDGKVTKVVFTCPITLDFAEVGGGKPNSTQKSAIAKVAQLAQDHEKKHKAGYEAAFKAFDPDKTAKELMAKTFKDLESLGFAQNFLSSCELEALHFIGIRSFGEEFREDVVFRGIQEKFRKPLA
jgi:hypothetical protein